MSDPNTGTTAETYPETYVEEKTTEKTTVTPLITTQSEAIATYFIDDLTDFIRDMRIDLLKYLEFPPEESQDLHEVLQMLFDDLARMLRDRLITGIHLLLSANELDPNVHAYPVLYHAHYQVFVHERILGAPKDEEPKSERWGGRLEPPPIAWTHARFALLIDWAPSASRERRKRVNRKFGYLFDWVPDNARYDPSSLLKFRDGGLTMVGANLATRVELQVPRA